MAFNLVSNFWQMSVDATNYLKTAAGYLTSAETYSILQSGAGHFASGVLPSQLTLEKKSVAIDPHPLQTLYPQLQKAIDQQLRFPDLRQRLDRMPEKLRDAILVEMNGSVEPGDEARLLGAIKNVVERTLDAQEQLAKNTIYGTLYRIAGQPQTPDLQWGEHNAKEDTLRLIRALHRHQHLEISGKEIAIYSELEKMAKQPSCLFHLYRKEPERGSIGFHNGICNTLEDVKSSTLQLSDRCAQGHNIHCSYSATVNTNSDIYSAALGQSKISTPGVLQLLERWNDYFEQNSTDPLLQICHSRGAIEVYNALMHLPEEKRQRIIVIAVAPAYFIPNTDAKKVINLVIPSDPIPKVAINRHVPNPNTMLLSEHADGKFSHLFLGSSYMNALAPLIDRYLRTNEI